MSARAPGAAALNDASREITATRLFDAPRDLVFRTWTDPEHLGNWWGPRGCTITTHAIDVRPGGSWDFVMHGPDGADYDNKIVFNEIEGPERLAYTHVTGPVFDVTVTFDEVRQQQTRVTVRMLFESAEVRDRVVEEYGAGSGLHQTLDRLGEQLLGAGSFMLTRAFDAPRDLVYRVWTERDHLVHWWGPKGFTVIACTNDLRPGGLMHYGLRAANGVEMWGRWLYREIVPPERLSFIASFSDPQAAVTRPPFPDPWPSEMLTAVTFIEDGERTTVTVESQAYHATDEERATFANGHASMQQGWGGTFDQLRAYMQSLRP